MRIFLISFLQMGLISSQIFHIAQSNYFAAFLTSVGISSCWIFNVNRVINRGKNNKIAYIAGAAIGTIFSMYINNIIGDMGWTK